ncbi:MAG: MMPL family transporter [Prevotellaceae bacterium]|jgi:predicted exporter|nr:MMPL family transporter [Prevotellaceae bacterium]
MSHFFIHLFDFFRRRKVLLWLLLAGIVALSAVSASRISFVEDISSFLPNNADSKRINEAYQKIGAANRIMVTFSQRDTATGVDEELLSGAAARFAEILQASDSARHIKVLTYEVDNEIFSEVADFITQNIPYFLEEDDYQRIDSFIQPQIVENQLKADKELLMSPMGGFVRSVILNDPLHFSKNALKNLEVFKQNNSYSTDNGFIFNKKGECIVTITSSYPVSETANNKLLANEIYNVVNQAVSEFNGEVKIVPFGAALISIANAEQIKKDSVFAVSIALILILALLFYFFRNGKQLLLIALSVAFGALFSLGAMVLFKSTISVIAIGIASIIFGIAINYPLHFLAHYRHHPSILQTIKEIVNPLLIGNITTVGAFLSLLFISSPAMHDLGLFSAFLLIGTIVFVLVFLPHFLSEQRSKNKEQRQEAPVFTRLSNFSPEKNKLVVLIFLIFTLALFFFSFGTKFESNLHAINYMTAEQRAEMNMLMAENKEKTAYVVAEGKTTEEALQNYEELVEPQMRKLSSKSGIANFFPSKERQHKKIERWNKFWEWNDSANHECSKKDLFTGNLSQLAKKKGFNAGVFSSFNKVVNKNYEVRDFEYFAPIYKNMGENYFSIDSSKTLIYTIIRGYSEKISGVMRNAPVNAPVFTFDDTSSALLSCLPSSFSRLEELSWPCSRLFRWPSVGYGFWG